MDMEILITILLCVIAAMCTLLSLFYFAKRRQKSYEQVNMLLASLTSYFGLASKPLAAYSAVLISTS